MIALQKNDQYIGQLLLRDGLITGDELQKGLKEQRDKREFLCSTLVRMGIASEEKIFSILSLQIGIPYLSLKDFKVDPVVLGRVPGGFARAFKCMPLKVVDDIFYVAMSDPLNMSAVDEFKAYFGLDKLKIFLSGDNDICEAIKKYYGI